MIRKEIWLIGGRRGDWEEEGVESGFEDKAVVLEGADETEEGASGDVEFVGGGIEPIGGGKAGRREEGEEVFGVVEASGA